MVHATIRTTARLGAVHKLSMTAELRTERHAATLVLTIDAPASSDSASAQIASGIVEVLAVAESDPTLRCVVLQGAGGAFGAGLRDDTAPAGHRGDPGPLHALLESVRSFPKPVIAVVEGLAVDAGFSLALACDLLVVAEDASLRVPRSDAAGVPEPSVTWQLARVLPHSTALDWLWRQEPVSARELERRGLVTRTAPRGQALAEALRLAQGLAQQTPATISATKEAFGLAAARFATPPADRCG